MVIHLSICSPDTCGGRALYNHRPRPGGTAQQANDSCWKIGASGSLLVVTPDNVNALRPIVE
ncbi:hypothetical protein MXD59_24330 [Frankia sp. Ag45/Mut15]|uniref:Uncharacterized protein n=1 Tax=Frankia umida TaxID=573489 RepID=A0ABT0K4X5_9ACTN|nr:hypothetical protein [Frankia umida]MCK9878850.1 hypothetical protein [Frankia umida]